uniref:Tick transposon n=1 Tax=Rhipicephalus zambeziensis TaxID=60191 RepID=A0A224Z7Z9_9ACAR
MATSYRERLCLPAASVTSLTAPANTSTKTIRCLSPMELLWVGYRHPMAHCRLAPFRVALLLRVNRSTSAAPITMTCSSSARSTRPTSAYTFPSAPSSTDTQTMRSWYGRQSTSEKVPAIARSCFHHALIKSCIHRCETSFLNQTHRLRQSGYPMALLASVAETLLKGSRSGSAAATSGNDARFRPKNVLVIPYVHTVSHNLRKLGRKVGLDVAFSAPARLSALCKKANSQSKRREACSIKHRNPYVTCTECVVYSIPLTCNKVYVGQTGRCLNTRLTEHNYHCSKKDAGHLAIHCRDCGCAPMLGNTRVVCKEKGKIAREILEAAEMFERKEDCISCPSVALSSKERKFLGFNR